MTPVPDSMTLARLHKVLQIVMGWTDSHLHEFQIDGTRYGVPDPDFDEGEPLLSEKGVTLDAALSPSVTRFLYCYDVALVQAGYAKRRRHLLEAGIGGSSDCVMECPELATDITAALVNRLPARSYRVHLRTNRRLEWVETGEDKNIVHAREPRASWWRRVSISLLL